MNKVILTGRLTADPELRETPSGTKVARFNVAVDRRYKRDGEPTADFIPCVAWRKAAEFVYQHFSKGKSIALDGQMQTRSWDDQNGHRHYVTEVIVDNVEFNGPKETQQNDNYPYKGGNSSAGYQKPEQMKIDEFGLEDVSEDDLPF